MTERDETRERFLSAIAYRLDPDRVEEVHLFAPIKQGGSESAVAVVAVNEQPGNSVPDAEHSGADGDAHPARSAGAENRFSVYTAKYRLTLKGPDRGKWDFSMHVEADAPLVTVDKVVQGVQRRSGDAEDPEKLSGDDFRAQLPPRSSEETQGQSA
jgi:hypothetical protein